MTSFHHQCNGMCWTGKRCRRQVLQFLEPDDGLYFCYQHKPVRPTDTIVPTISPRTTAIPRHTEEHKTVACPLCRADNQIPNKQAVIKGLSDICCICRTDPVSVYFPTCGHVCACRQCLAEIPTP
uniref:RING-type domain-containing protein n=1 Tax=viral metagenome TaxID=1070528 RepID=A0A6C0BKG9_9ZZZZ